MVTADVRFSGSGNGNIFLNNIFWELDSPSGTIINYNYSPGTTTVASDYYDMLLPVTMVIHVSAGGF